MIIAAVTALAILFSSGAFSFDHIRDAADAVIKDKDRAKQVISITKQADEYLESLTEKLGEQGEQYADLNANYNTTREEHYALSHEIGKNRREFLEQLVELRFQIQDLVTAEEYQEIVIKRKQLY